MEPICPYPLFKSVATSLPSIHLTDGPFYLPADDDVVYVSPGVMAGNFIASICLDEDGDFQVFAEGDDGDSDPALVHYGHLAAGQASLAELPRLPLNHWAIWEPEVEHWRVVPD